MQLHTIRGGTKEELENKQYIIGVGISLGNKWFTPQNIVELVKWSLDYSKDKVIVYVADSIHSINEEVRGKMSAKRALMRSTRMGAEILQSTRELIEDRFSKDIQDKITFITWNKIVDATYEKKTAYLIELFYASNQFSEKIKNIVKNSVANEKRKFNEKDIERLSMYIISEMPEVICRVPMGEFQCDAYVYPFDGELTRLAEQIQKGEIFPEIRQNIMDTKPKVFLEVR